MDGYPGITDRDAAEILFRDEKTTERNVRANDQGKLAKKTMYQNLGIISLTFLLLFSAFHSLQSLQTSIHVADGLNNIGIIVLNVTFMVSCMFLPPFILSKFGLKKTIMFSMLGYVSYTAASLFTNWLTIIPASVVLGVLASTLWTGQMCFVTQLAIMYSEVTGANLKVSSSRFFGIFYAVYYTGYIWGNMAYTLVFSSHNRVNATDDQQRCGTAFCPKAELTKEYLVFPDTSKVYWFLGISLGFGLLAMVLLSILLDNLKTTRQTVTSLWTPLTETLRHFRRSGYQKLLVPVTIYRGLSTSFLIGDFNAAFTGCYLGVHNVGYLMICYGISCSLASYIHGIVARLTGYHVPFITAFILHIGTGIALFLWTPSTESHVPFYAIVCLWAVGNTVYSSVLAPLYGSLFRDSTDAAMSSFNLLTALGWLISLGLSSFVCTYVKLALILVSLVISTACVLVVILHEKWYAKPYSLVSDFDLTQRDIAVLTTVKK